MVAILAFYTVFNPFFLDGLHLKMRDNELSDFG